MITSVVVRTLGWVALRRLVGLVGLGPGLDAKTWRSPSSGTSSRFCTGKSGGPGTRQATGWCWPAWRGYYHASGGRWSW
jgi:hypothetical protein